MRECHRWRGSLCLTERAVEQLIPVIGHRMKFLNVLEKLRKNCPPAGGDVVETVLESQTLAQAGPSDKESDKQTSLRKRPAVSPLQSKGDVTLNAKKPWPTTLVLPRNLRPDVARVLSDGEKLTNKQRMSFIRSLYDHFSLYTLYPTRDQLTGVSELIVRTYPALKDKSVGTGYDSWFAQLYEKFRNERKHLVDDPAVILRKKSKTSAAVKGKFVSAKLRRGALNWEPPYPEGEDEASMKKHKEALETEWRRRNPDMEKVEHRMMLTFPDRRRQMNKQIEITELKAEYPSLFDFSQILAEFERILGLETSILGTFKANFDQVSDGIIHMAKQKKGKASGEMEQWLAMLKDEFGDDADMEPSADEKAEVAMAVLPLLLQAKSGVCSHKDFVEFISEESNSIRTAESRDKPFPFLLFSGSLQSPGKVHLAADKQIICTFEKTLMESTLALLATYYVFMFNYPPGLNNFYLYLQKCILQIQDGRKLPSSIISFVNSLHDLQSRVHSINPIPD
ncbi:sterile alpha motif domain-containing protein 3-like isoform X1 [Montipora capricornis]|uniref:sterile alpha motif domain-containing protein 3-like isoform X1 n=2 Tax=Montipora capricornis TaxID=246305 RepID=UPI0035F1E543